MAGSVNTVTLVGNLGKDPEVRNTQSGGRIVSMTLATSESWIDKASGERREKTEWHRIVSFNDRLAEVAERFLKKGRKIYLEGALQTRKWTGPSGVEKFTTEVVLERFCGELTLLDSNRDAGGGEVGSYGQSRGSTARQPASAGAGAGGWSPSGGIDDEIPFSPCWQ